jgi:hypothetical protein
MTTGLYRRVALAVHDAKTLTGAQIRDLFYDVEIVTLTNAVRNAISEGYVSGPISYSMRLDAVFEARRAPAAKARTGPVPLLLHDTPPVVQQKRDYPAVRASRDDRPVPDRSHLWPQLMGNALYEDDPRSLAERHILWRRPVPQHRLFSSTGCAAAMLVASR